MNTTIMPAPFGGNLYKPDNNKPTGTLRINESATIFFNATKTVTAIGMWLFFLLFSVTARAQMPVANFSSNIISGCVPILVNFTDNSAGNPTEWKWDLGNGTFSNLQNPSVTYFSPGLYSIKLIIKEGNNKDSVIKTNYITVYGSPVANFNAANNIGCSPLAAIFFDASIARESPVSQWHWDFGDGILSSLQSPSHTYTLAGSYNVTLKITNTNGCASTIRKTGLVKVNSIKASFNSSVFATCEPNKIVFQNTSSSSSSTNSIALWDFGDGTFSPLSNPTHVYATGGNYSVKLVVRNQQGCIDSSSANLQVRNPVSAFFSADKLEHCKPPAIVHFTNLNLDNASYYWQFGDSTIAVSPNPVHEYAEPGIFTVKLLIKNANGCTDSIERVEYIKVNKPFFYLRDLPDSNCQPFTKKLSAGFDTATTITQYLWNFGDGSISSDSTPVHSFSNTGYYTVSLIATAFNGCRDTISIQNAIRVTAKPVANFSADIKNVCASKSVSFINLSTGATSWEWRFGDNTTAGDQNPVHSYKDTGWMTVMLIAKNGGCTDTMQYTNYIYIKPALAKYTIITNCAKPFERQFINVSKGATRCEWDFGDGTTSAEYSPTHTFPGQGIFTITLKVWNDSTGCEHSLTKEIKILKITPSFFASDTIVCKGDAVSFLSGNGGPDVVRYYWDFGDGATLISRIPSTNHRYLTAGLYTIKLVTISILNCADTIIKSSYIKVNGPTASFALPVPVVCANTTVLFTDNSVASAGNPIQQWIWNYADGKIDTLYAAPFLHTYTAQASYSISLKLIDSKGCTDFFKIPVPLKINKVTARFVVVDTVACPGLPVRFTCPFTAAGAVYKWDFGDGATATIANPVHTYLNEGVYSVRLYLRDAVGCEDSITIAHAVRIVQTMASFEMSDSFKTCPPLLVQFSSRSLHAVSEYWDFGDSTFTNAINPSHYYTYPGVYTATLFAKGPGGCVAVMRKQIVVKGPKGNITYDPLKLCRPYDVNFQVHAVEAVSFIWDFNDGNTMSTNDSLVSHSYQDSGKFLPKILLIDDIGCRVPVTGRDTITNVFVKAAFTFPVVMGCTQSDIPFTNNTIGNDEISDWQWDFGDSTSIHQKDPVHQYTLAGTYFPSIKVTTVFGCVNEYKSIVPLTIAATPDVRIVSSGNGCAPLTTVLLGEQAEGGSLFTHWNWDMGNGNTYQMQNPLPQFYTTAGVYTVKLTATSNVGCVKTIHTDVEAYSSPVLQAPADTLLCKGQSILLKANGAAKYKWIPSQGLSCDTCSTVIAHPVSSAQYLLSGTSSQGCTSSKTISIVVKQPLKIQYNTAEKLCKGQNKILSVSGADTYQWWPSAGLSNASIAAPLAQPDTSTIYRVIGADNAGCFKDTGYIKLTVFQIPFVDAGADKTINVGRPVDLESKYSADVTLVQWYPTDGAFRNSNNSITVKPKKNTEYTVEVKNEGGCAASDKVNVFVLCNGTNVFMPNLFSPNSDGVNDVFYPRGTGLFKIKNLRIFNRWGEAVFEKSSFSSNDPSAGWDGTFKGTKLNTDVFIYTMELICDNNSVLALNGNISLVR